MHSVFIYLICQHRTFKLQGNCLPLQSMTLSIASIYYMNNDKLGNKTPASTHAAQSYK